MKKVLIVIAAFIFVFFAFFAIKGVQFYQGIFSGKNGSLKNSILPVNKTTYTILLLGYGGEGHDGPYLTDSMMVVQVDLKQNKASLISLPRDLWVKLPTRSKEVFHSKINSIYQMGVYEQANFPDVDTKSYPNTELVKKAVHDITGLEIDSYVTVSFAGFTKAIDVMGGVDIDVLKTFDDYEYPIEGKEKELCGKDAEFAQIEKFMKPGYSEEEKQKLFQEKPELETFFKNITEDPKEAFPCRYEHLHFDAGKTHMNGETALKYVRSRHSLQDGTDFGRAARQQQFVKAVKDKAMSIGIVTKIAPLLDEMKKHITTDISVDDMKKFTGEIGDAGKYKLINIRMSDSDYLKSSFSDYGGYILIPRIGEDDWSEVHTIIKNGILEITPTPTASPKIKLSPTKKPTL